MSNDALVFGGCFIAAILLYLVIGTRPRQFYAKVLARIRWLMSLRLIAKSELDNLYRQIDVLNEQITMLHTAPIKQDKGGQLQFSDLFGTDDVNHLFIELGPFPGKNDTLWWQMWKPKDYEKHKANMFYVRRDKRRPQWVTEKLKNDVEVIPYSWKQLSPEDVLKYKKKKVTA